MKVMHLSGDQLEETITNIERELDYVHLLAQTFPAPVLLYDKEGKIAWCNKAMRNLFWGTITEPTYTGANTVFNKHVSEVMPDYLWPYVLEQNEKVLKTHLPQYEEWSDDVWVSIKWKCLRWRVSDQYVAVVLFPATEEHLLKCHEATLITKDD